VRAASEGLIEKIWVDRGDMVKAGQVLVTLDSGVERAATEAARYRSTMQGRDPDRREPGRVRDRQVQPAREARRPVVHFAARPRRGADREAAGRVRTGRGASDDRRLAEIEYRRLSELLRLRTIRSPVDGVVVDRLLSAGELADNRDLRKPILRLADIGTLFVEVLMPIEAFGKLVLEPDRRGVARAAGRRPLHVAKVKVIDRVHDAASGTFGVRLEMANPGIEAAGRGSSARRILRVSMAVPLWPLRAPHARSASRHR
jgi:multidrug efflux pump subunit AcrA (membrane-fusion protein)